MLETDSKEISFTFKDNGETIPFEDVFIKHNIDPNKFIEGLHEPVIETSINNIECLFQEDLEASTFASNNLVYSKGELIGRGCIISITNMDNKGSIHICETDGGFDFAKKNITRPFFKQCYSCRYQSRSCSKTSLS